MENRAGTVEAGWTWAGGSSTSKDTWSEICGDGVDAAVKDSAAIVIKEIRQLINNSQLNIMSKILFKKI